VDLWIVKGGPSLKLLAADMAEYEQQLRATAKREAADSSTLEALLAGDTMVVDGVNDAH
jgi:hypothetical protein